MIVSLAGFVCSAVLIIYANRDVPAIKYTVIGLSVPCIFLSFFMPLIAKAFMYNKNLTQIKGVSVAYLINKYKLSGWITGKYLFFDAVINNVNGCPEEAFDMFRQCLKKTKDKRLRLACYNEIMNIHDFDGYMRMLPFMLEACREFPDNSVFFEWCSGYYIFFDQADEREGSAWFRAAAENTSDRSIKARAFYYLGVNRLYNMDYSAAEDCLMQAYELFERKFGELCVDMAVCCTCLKKYEEARKYAIQAVAVSGTEQELDRIKEKLDYLFITSSEALNPDTEKLVAEIKRRKAYFKENSIKTEDIENIERQIDTAKGNT